MRTAVPNIEMDKMDLRNYFKRKSKNDLEEPMKKKQKTKELITSAVGMSNAGELQIVSDEVSKAVRPTKHQKIPESIRKEVASHALKFGTKSAITKFAKKYETAYEFHRTTVNSWKNALKKKSKSVPVCGKIGRPNMVEDVILEKIKDIIIGTRAAGTVISRRIAIAIGKGVIKANNPQLLTEYGGSITLTENWARGLLSSMNWVKRKGTTGKIEPSAKFLQEEKFTFQRQISEIADRHNIPPEMILNLDQTPLAYVSPGKFTFAQAGSTTVPIKGVDDKCQITATFAVSA